MNLNSIINVCIAIASVVCVATVLICLFKILVGDEQDSRIYSKRIRNAIIALIAIMLIKSISALVIKYFPDDAIGIGTMKNFSSVSSSISSGFFL